MSFWGKFWSEEKSDELYRRQNANLQKFLIKLSQRFLFSILAIQANILSRKTEGEWMKYTINVISIYKRSSHQKRGETFLWVPKRHVKCKCPKLRLGRRYFLVGRLRSTYRKPGYIADNSTVVIRHRDRWHKKIKSYMRKERRGKCNSSDRRRRT